MSITDVNKKTGVPLSTIRGRLKNKGVLRSRTDGVRLAATDGKLSHMKGKRRTFTPEWKKNISEARLAHGEKFAAGTSIKPNGYVEYTRGANKGRSVHTVAMEKRIGRRLNPDECVHHIDENKQNNDANNLALMTKSGHGRHHRMYKKGK